MEKMNTLITTLNRHARFVLIRKPIISCITLETLKQQALDYTLGVMPKEESLLFEALLENDEDAMKFLVEAQEDFANLSLTAPPSSLGNEVRSRVMEYTEPKMDFDPFLSSNDINRSQG